MPSTDSIPTRPDCFQRQVKQILKSFPNYSATLEKYLTTIEANPAEHGDRIPGFAPLHVRKCREGIPQYRIGKSGGIRIIFLTDEAESNCCFIAAYYKGDYRGEQAVVNMVKANLREILS